MTSDLCENILGNFGGASRNNLNDIIGAKADELNELTTESFSPYIVIDDLPDYMLGHKDGFCVLTLNCQSLNSKFNQLKAMTHLLNNTSP